MATQQTKVILLSDGRFGHQRIALGIAQSLSRLQDLDVAWLRLNEIGKPHRSLQRLKALFGSDLSNLSYAISTDDKEGLPTFPLLRSLEGVNIDFVAGAGPSCAAPAIAIARHFRARSIYFGNPKIPFFKEFDVLIRFGSSWWNGSPSITHFRPNDIIPDLSHEKRDTSFKSASVLIGGNKDWNKETAKEFCNLIKKLSEMFSVKVFNSRRTPNVVSDMLAEYYAQKKSVNKNDDAKIHFVDSRVAGFNSNIDAYTSDLVVVTADSMSMIAESVSAQRPVIVLIPAGYIIPKSDMEEISYFIKHKYVSTSTTKLLIEHGIDLNQVSPMKEDHTLILAQKLKLLLEGS